VVRPARGFTVVEVVVALTLLSLLVLAVVTALRTFAQTQVRTDRVVAENDALRIVSSFLRNHITQAQPVQLAAIPEAGRSYGIYFIGRDRELVWVAPFVGGLTAGGLHVMRLTLGGGDLRLQLAPYRGLDSWPEWGQVANFALLQDVTALEFAYRGVGSNEWLPEWDYGLMTPRSVRVRLAQADRFWPDLVIRLDAAEMAFD